MNWKIRKLSLGLQYQKTIDISKIDYDKIFHAKEILTELIEIEEFLDCLIENFLELENDSIQSAFRFSILHQYDQYSFSLFRTQLNRRLSNFLSSARGYLDRLSRFSKRPDIKLVLGNLIDDERHKAYDNSLSYRLMEGLRNQVQHYGCGIHILSFNSKWVETDTNETIRSNSVFKVTINELKKARIIKAKIISELASIGNEIDLRIHIRNYISLIGEVHHSFVTKMKEQVECLDKVLISRIDEYLSTFPEEKNTLALYACACDERDAVIDSVPIYKYFIEFRKILESKHQFVKFIHKHFVTNEVT